MYFSTYFVRIAFVTLARPVLQLKHAGHAHCLLGNFLVSTLETDSESVDLDGELGAVAGERE